jgi:hypothetical protein
MNIWLEIMFIKFIILEYIIKFDNTSTLYRIKIIIYYENRCEKIIEIHVINLWLFIIYAIILPMIIK